MCSDTKWIDAKEKLPPSGKTVFLAYVNSNKKNRLVLGNFTEKYTDENYDTDGDFCEYSEEKDNYYVPEGWYECSFSHDEHGGYWLENQDVLFWAELPEFPKEAELEALKTSSNSSLNRDQAKLLRYTYANFSKEDVDKIIDRIYNIVDKERKLLEDEIAEHIGLFIRIKAILDDGDFWKLDDDGFWHSSLHKDLSKVCSKTKKLSDRLGTYHMMIKTLSEKNEELEFNMSEHKRLHGELNDILHPNGDKPEKPSLCDLVAYVQKDLKDLRSRTECTIESTTSTCKWKKDSDDEYNVYNTECENAQHFSNDDNPSENEYKFCPCCSGEIKVISSFSLRESLS